ncbi:topoisomerase DNA-binding C4 zinc finger domain-containing protein [Mesobacillus jeotgali]
MTENICLRCGSPLVSRTVNKGIFIGCSSYPICRFTA